MQLSPLSFFTLNVLLLQSCIIFDCLLERSSCIKFSFNSYASCFLLLCLLFISLFQPAWFFDVFVYCITRIDNYFPVIKFFIFIDSFSTSSLLFRHKYSCCCSFLMRRFGINFSLIFL